MKDDKGYRPPKGWAFLDQKAKINAKAATQPVLDKIENGQFTKLGELNPPISKELAQTIFRAMLKEAAQRQRDYDFPIYQLLFSQAVKNCVSFVIANKLDDAAIDTMEIKTIMKITPGFFSTLILAMVVVSAPNACMIPTLLSSSSAKKVSPPGSAKIWVSAAAVYEQAFANVGLVPTDAAS